MLRFTWHSYRLCPLWLFRFPTLFETFMCFFSLRNLSTFFFWFIYFYLNSVSSYTFIIKIALNQIMLWKLFQWHPTYIKFSFLSIIAIIEPLLSDSEAKNYMTCNVNPTLLKGLTALCKRKPADPLVSTLEEEKTRIKWSGNASPG